MAGESRAYTDWLRTLPCVACGRPPGSGLYWTMRAHHRTGAGKALRAHDHLAIPLHNKCHEDLHSFKGAFYPFKKAHLREFQDTAIAICQARYALRDAGFVPAITVDVELPPDGVRLEVSFDLHRFPGLTQALEALRRERGQNLERTG